MPNWCFSSYVIEGRKKELQSLHSKMKRLEKRKKSLVENGFGKTWLGNLATRLGGDWQEVYCRGSWSDLDWNGAILRFNTETAWGPMTEVFNFIKSIYPSLEIYYMAEENGNGVFITNDTEGRFFSDRYYLDSDGPVDDHYFETIEELAQVISEIVGHPVGESFEECEKALDDHMEKNPDEWYSLHEFRICDD